MCGGGVGWLDGGGVGGGVDGLVVRLGVGGWLGGGVVGSGWVAGW